jgi:hypothetical protein
MKDNKRTLLMYVIDIIEEKHKIFVTEEEM